ncbi:MAG: choice-of-anchor J domain-containing protein [Muribaculaceae bacterium]|nr:choice-of-anchor J domain-containing protein [Muribaculaceae bacterium]
MYKKISLVLLLSATLTMGAVAQKRSPQYQGSTRSVAPIERTKAATRQARNFAPTFSKEIGRVGLMHDASAIARSYTTTPPMRVLGDGTTIYGSVIYSSAWRAAEYGLYTFKASSNPEISKYMAIESYQANGGGTYADGKYYYNSYVYDDEGGWGYTFSTFCTVDLATGNITRVTQGFLDGTFDQTQITHDMTYDPTTGQIFVVSYIKETDDTGLIEYFRPAVSTLDNYTGFVTPIAKTPSFIAIAANNAGELYGISKGASSALYRINKETGECTEIGRTGLNPEYVQSATFDPITDKLYWAATELNGNSGLYEVNVSTGKAEEICRFTNNEEITGIYIPAPEVSAAAPAAVSNQTVSFIDASLSGQLKFTVPSVAYNGSTLSAPLTADVTVDGEGYATLDVTPGQAVSLDISLTEGVHGYSVQISNSIGEGPRTGYSWYVGIDGPGHVENLTLEANSEGEPVISWTAPGVGRNGGYIDPTKLTYDVVRYPEVKMVASGISATTVTDTSKFDASNVYYVVTAYCDGRQGVETSTAEGLFGSGSELPVTFNFDNIEDFELCTVIDANNDGDAQYHWGYWFYSEDYSWTSADKDNADRPETPCVVYGYNPLGPADDWIIMPPFTAEQGKKYRVTFRMWTRGNKEKLSVTAGPTATVADQKVILAEKEYNHTNHDSFFTAEFSATTTGNCYVGFHCTSASKMYYLFVDDVTIDEVPATDAPAAVENLTVTPGAKGALTATIEFKTPTVTADGKALSSLERIDIFRGNDNNVIHSFESPATGADLSWTDTEAVQGFNTYRVVAVNASGAGEKAVETAYVGYDLPTAPTEVSLEDYDGHPVLRWIAPETGQNGGYINPDELIYRIIRSDNVIMSTRATGTEFVDMTLDPKKQQYFVYYQIEPISAAGIGDYALSNHIIFGDPYEGDFFESFSDAALSTDPWTTYLLEGNQQLWTLMSQGYYPYCMPADYDGGLAVFSSSDGRPGWAGRLVSPKLRIDDMPVPLFSFAFYHEMDYYGDVYADRLIPEVRLPDGTYVALDEPIYVTDEKYDSGWWLYTYDLSDFKQYGAVQLSFHGIAEYANDVYIDMVSLESNVEYDLLGYTFSGPTSVQVGKTGKYRATIFNQGVKAADGYRIDLYRDGKVLLSDEATKPLASGEFATHEFSVPSTLEEEGNTYKYNVKIVFDKDEVLANNESEYIITRITAPDVPEPRFVEGEVTSENNVTLTWGEADALQVEDSFESYAAFSISDIGDYTLVDGDGAYTYTFTDIKFDNSGEPFAFMVFNPVVLGITMLDEYKTHTGNQVLTAWSSYDATTGKAVTNNDWFISPEVHPGTTVSFWAKTPGWEYGYESFEVMYSTTDRSTSAFNVLESVSSVPTEWTEYTYTLPSNAKYFAIHYNANDKFILYIDDLSFNAVCKLDGAEHSGYRIYRDGTAITETTATTHSYVDSNVAEGNHTYTVTALFGERESKPVAVSVKVGESSLTEVASDNISITSDNGYILIEGVDGLAVSVSNPAGMTLFAADDAPSYKVAVAKGVYIVRAGDTVCKLIVR